MKVYELIAELQKVDPEANVLIYNRANDVPEPDVWFDITDVEDSDVNVVIEVE